MNLEKLFEMQQILDNRIEREHNLQNQELFFKKVLALQVEVGELANETRCFKFWSLKKPSEASIILEEYVDCLHFILSLGIETNLQNTKLNKNLKVENNTDTTEMFLNLNEKINIFAKNKCEKSYIDLFEQFILLGNILGFSSENIEEAYLNKNKINHQRQDEGY
ncbi:MAG: dUTP diphosphatase [Clostridium argentinense]|uniref:dUTP diphosphatase n=1 Tax=Clostridium faecium TaxID=2762223 RepID=A0ABR8YRV7_9CLOT|nr:MULTISPECIES: dUTP diphosphatase [Clostridium]MBD8046987.1 dUTP diphosphatase [Clostridium faecium]MBS5823175.1 dUTP diphosphatase [Clostridium argentinense]MDU1349249.1 dUTP diphosphatase [Clostridium argentinense]